MQFPFAITRCVSRDKDICAPLTDAGLWLYCRGAAPPMSELKSDEAFEIVHNGNKFWFVVSEILTDHQGFAVRCDVVGFSSL
jgi:hypothetical protein